MNKITNVSSKTVHFIETDSDDDMNNFFTRYGPDCWMVRMGESDEFKYDCEGLEMQFQQYIKDNE